MSASFQPLTPVCVRDPRTIVTGAPKYGVLKSGSQVTFKQYSTTSISTSSLQFSCPPPSGGVFVDRNVRLYVPVRLTFTGVPPNGVRLIRPNYDAPRAYPLSSAIETLSATLNNQQVSINLSDCIQPLMWYNSGDELKNAEYSTTPCYQDQSQSYADLDGSIRNPLANYENGLDNTPQPRGSFPFVVVQNPPGNGVNPVTAIIDCAFNESLYLSPFWWGRGVSNEAFFNLTAMDFNITFLQKAANRFWSHSGVPFTSASYSFGGGAGGGTTSFGSTTGDSPYMLFTYITPQETQPIGPNMAITYPYFEVQRYVTAHSKVASGATANMISNNIQLSSIPRRVYVFARKRNQDLQDSAANTDTYFAMTSLSVQFMNKNGLFSSANMGQLYQMSVKNGCTMSWSQWSGQTPSATLDPAAPNVGTVGSVCCIEFGTDVGLDSLDAPGKLCQAMLQVQANFKNVSAAEIEPELYIICVSEGTFTIEGLNKATSNVGVLTSKDILDCQAVSGVDYSKLRDVTGGDFFSGIKEGLSAISRAAPAVKQFLQKSNLLSTMAAVVAPEAVPALRALGYGAGEGCGEGVLAGRMRGPRSRVRFGRGEGAGEGEGEGEGEGGSYASGGAAMARRDLARRILY